MPSLRQPIPASADALNLHRALVMIRELVALHRARGPLTPTCEQVCREATAFVDIGGQEWVDVDGGAVRRGQHVTP